MYNKVCQETKIVTVFFQLGRIARSIKLFLWVRNIQFYLSLKIRIIQISSLTELQSIALNFYKMIISFRTSFFFQNFINSNNKRVQRSVFINHPITYYNVTLIFQFQIPSAVITYVMTVLTAGWRVMIRCLVIRV